MDETIKQIIAIDREASAMLEEAEREYDKTIKEKIVAKNEELRSQMKDHAEERLNKVRATEQEIADEKLAEINRTKEASLASLREIYEKNRAAWEDDLFQRVVKGE